MSKLKRALAWAGGILGGALGIFWAIRAWRTRKLSSAAKAQFRGAISQSRVLKEKADQALAASRRDDARIAELQDERREMQKRALAMVEEIGGYSDEEMDRAFRKLGL